MSVHNPYGQGEFFDPFLTESTQFMPSGLNTDVWQIASYLWGLNKQFSAAMSSIPTYFLTDIEFKTTGKTGDDGEQRWLREFLHDHVKFFSHIGPKAGQEWACYDNSFVRPLHPFRRQLIDQRNGHSTWSISQLQELGPVKFIPERMMYEVVDPLTVSRAVDRRSTIQLPFEDTRTEDENELEFSTLDIRDVYCDITPEGRRERLRQIFPADHTRLIRTGDPFYVSTMPKIVIDGSLHNKAYEHKDGTVFHFKSPMIAGILRYCGFGIPQSIQCFRDIYHLRVLRRVDEVIGQDMVIPLKIVSPATGGGPDRAVDPIYGAFAAEMGNIVKAHRSNPYAIHASPFPVTGENLFGNGRELVPVESLDRANMNLMRALRIPAELFEGSMKNDLDPRVLRLFNSAYAHVYQNLNSLLRFIVDMIYLYRKEDKPDVRLKHPSMADDLETRQIVMQLNAAGRVSSETTFRMLGLKDPVVEAAKYMEEQLGVDQEKSRLQKKVDSEAQLALLQQQAAAGGQAAPGGAEAGQQTGAAPDGAPPVPTSGGTDPASIQALAQTTAERWADMPEGDRTKEMQQLSTTNFNLYSVAQKLLEKIRSRGASIGRQNATQMIASQEQQQQA